MELEKYTLINSIDPSLGKSLVKARIVKLWSLPSFKIKNAVYQYDMVLMDEEGHKIQATVMGSYVRKFEKFMEEKACIVISKPDVGDNVAKNKILQHPHRLFFNFETEISRCDDFTGSFYGFNFAGFDVLQTNGIPNETTVDVIGYVYTYFPKEDYKTKNGKIAKRMNLQLRDLQSRSLFITLWETHANKMEEYLNEKEEGVPAVIVLQFGKYLFGGGRAYVHSQFHVTNLFINNAEIDEISSMKNSLNQLDSDSTSSRQLIPSQYASNTTDDFLSLTDFNTIEQANRLEEAKYVIVMGTVITFAPESEWYYAACKTCKKKLTSPLEDINNDLICSNPSCNNKAALWIPKFKIPLRVQDSTGVISLTLFEDDAKQLLMKSSKDLLDMIMDDESPYFSADKIDEARLKMMPAEISELVGRKIAFKIHISGFNIEHNYRTFTVKKLTEDPDILSKLQANFELEQTPGSSIFKISDIGSQDTVSKDCLTHSAEDGNSFAAVDVANHVELKRNLIDVYDDEDDLVEQPSIKKPYAKSKGVKAETSTNLLIPKKEK